VIAVTDRVFLLDPARAALESQHRHEVRMAKKRIGPGRGHPGGRVATPTRVLVTTPSCPADLHAPSFKRKQGDRPCAGLGVAPSDIPAATAAMRSIRR